MKYLSSFIVNYSDRSELEVIFLFVLFAIIIAAAYYVTYYVAKFQKASKNNNNLQIVEAISVGPGKSIQIVRVGNKYIVIGVTKGNIQLLQTLGLDDICENSNKNSQSIIPFKQILNKYKMGKPKDSGEDHHESKDE
jgi:flagellar protein FliO/FliZ